MVGGELSETSEAPVKPQGLNTVAWQKTPPQWVYSRNRGREYGILRIMLEYGGATALMHIY